MDIKNMISPLTGSAPPTPLKNTSNVQPQPVEQQSGFKETFVNTEGPVEKSDRGTNAQKVALDQAVSKVNQLFQAEQRKLSFSINEATQGIVIEVKDAETDEVIRQIPPEVLVKLAERMQEMSAEESVGVLLKDKA